MAGGSLHISISAETLFSIGGFNVTNSILTSVIVSVIILTFCFFVHLGIHSKLTKKSKLQNFAELLVEGFFSFVDGVTNDRKKTLDFSPWILSFFLFILINNWIGLLPGVGTIGMIESETGEQHAQLLKQEISAGSTVYASEDIDPIHIQDEAGEEASEVDLEGHEAQGSHDAQESGAHAESSTEGKGKFVPYIRPGTADLNTTISLGIMSIILSQVFGFKYLKAGYLKKFINLSSPIMFFVGLLELVSEFAKIISFAFRLFGNIFAGEVLLAVISSLIPLIAPMPFYGLEIFVGFIQALVFSLLSLVFFNMATAGHDEH